MAQNSFDYSARETNENGGEICQQKSSLKTDFRHGMSLSYAAFFT